MQQGTKLKRKYQINSDTIYLKKRNPINI